MYIHLDIHRRRDERHGARIIKHSANEEERRQVEEEARRGERRSGGRSREHVRYATVLVPS